MVYGLSSTQVKRRLFVIVVATKQQCALGNAHVATNGHLVEVIDPNVFSNPRVVAYGELPRVLDGHLGLDHDPPANLGSEYAQQHSL